MPTIADALAQALQHHNAGNLQQAEQIYRQILHYDPNHADALHLLGELAYRAGKYDVAIDNINRALQLNPTAPAFHCNIGVVYQAVGRLNEAIHHFQRALQLSPNFPEAYNNLGVALKDLQRYDDAITCFQRASTLRPDYVDAINNMGISLADQGKMNEALACYHHVLRLRPGHSGACNNLGNACLGQRKFDEAVNYFREALRSNPNDHITYSNMGAALREQGKLDEAIASYRQALRLQPNFIVAYNNLGAALREQGKIEEAIASYEQALRIKPDYPEALLNLGSVFKEQRKFDEASRCIERAIQLQPNNAEAHNCLGNVYVDQGMVDEARACYEQGLRIKPTTRMRIVVATMLPLIYESMDHLRQSRQTFTDNIRRLYEEGVRLDLNYDSAQPPFFLIYQGMNDRDLQLALRQLYIAPAGGFTQQKVPVDTTGRKIRIGFISAYFKNHTIGRLMQGLMKHMSRDEFHVTVLATTNNKDEIADKIRGSGDSFVLVPANLPAARQLIARQQLDVLLYTDIGMDPFTYTLALSRLAPVQCVTWGHPSTTGLETVDYYLSSELFETDDAQQYYTEKLVRLKTIPAYAYRPTPPWGMEPLAAPGFRPASLSPSGTIPADGGGPVPSSQFKDRAQFGLRDDAHVYSCLQSLFKLHPEYDEILAGILRADPQATLVLSKGHYPHWYHLLQKRFTVTLPDVLDRIHFVGWQFYNDFLNLNAISDVLLDPIYFGGGRTTYESLSMGLPIVTMPSKMLSGRMALAMYRKMGVMDCVAQTPQQYVDLAVKLGSNPDLRNEVSRKISEANGVLFEDMEAVRELERFCKEALAGRVA